MATTKKAAAKTAATKKATAKAASTKKAAARTATTKRATAKTATRTSGAASSFLAPTTASGRIAEQPQRRARAAPKKQQPQGPENVANTVAFRTNDEDKRIIATLIRDGEAASDLLRRALRVMERDAARERMYADMARLASEDLSDEPDDWELDDSGKIVDLRAGRSGS